MTVLLWVTLGYAAVLVLVLAVGLGMVWLRLRGIHRGLAAVGDALSHVRAASEGLDERVEPIRERLLAAIHLLQEAAEDLSDADERVSEQRDATPAGRAG